LRYLHSFPTRRSSDLYSKSTIQDIEKDLKNIEKELDKVIEDDEKLSNLFEKATSVVGIGKVTALLLICFTNEFTMYENPRQLARSEEHTSELQSRENL